MKSLLFLIAAGLACGQTKIDFNSQISNRPVTRVAIPGTGLAAAVAAVPAGGTLVIPSGTYTVATGITVSAANVMIQCQPGALIQAAANVNVIILTGANQTIDGCKVDGRWAQNGYTSNAISLNGATGAKVRNNIATNAGVGIFITASSDVDVSYNTVTATQANSIYGVNNVSNIRIIRNKTDNTGSLTGGSATSSISVYTTVGGANASNILIEGNTITQGNANFCITVGAFGGNFPTDAKTLNNNCTAVVATYGNVSYSQVTRGLISGNHLDAGGFRIGFAMIELAATSYVVVNNHNDAINMAPLTADGFGGISLDQSSWNVVDSNDIPGILSLFTGNGSQTVPTISHNKITNNTITIPPGSTGVTRGAIWLQASSAKAGVTVSNNDFSHNRIIGNNAVPYAMVLENDSNATGAVVDSNTFEFNSAETAGVMFRNWTNSSITNVRMFQNSFGPGMVYTDINGTFDNSSYQDVGQMAWASQPNFVPWSMSGFIAYNFFFDVTASTVLVPITPIIDTHNTAVTFPVDANRAYAFEADLLVSVDAVGGQAFAVDCTCTYWAAQSWWFITVTAHNGSLVLSKLGGMGTTGMGVSGAGGTTTMTKITGFMQTQSTGSLVFRFAQNSASGLSRVYEGSHFRMWAN